MLILIYWCANFYSYFLSMILNYHFYLFICFIFSFLFYFITKFNNNVLYISFYYIFFLSFFIAIFWINFLSKLTILNLLTINNIFFFFMGGTFNLYSRLDKRQKIKSYKLEKYFYGKVLDTAYKKFKEQSEIEFWAGNLPFDSLIYLCLSSQLNKNNNNYIINFFTTNFESQCFYTFNFDYAYFYRFVLLLKLKYGDVYFPVDMCFYKNESTKNIVTGFSSYFTGSCYRLVFSFDTQFNDVKFFSISSIYSGFTWVERELSELNNITFLNLKDGRRLLTDYTTLAIDVNEYKTTGYNLAVENLYNNKMLHWLYVYSFLLSCSLLSFIFYNKNLISLLLISEIIILLVFFLTIVVVSFYNTNFLLSFSFFLLIFGGLELALNLLLLML